ncbi:MAG TPA: sulfatase [Thermoanaerobaculia bacterium]
MRISSVPAAIVLGGLAFCACSPRVEETHGLAELVAGTALAPAAARHVTVEPGGDLLLAAGAALDLLVELPARARLEVDRVEPLRGARFELDLVCADSVERRALERIEAPAPLARELRPARAATLPCALELRVAAAAGASEAAVRLRNPRLVRSWRAPMPPEGAPVRVATRPNLVIFLVDTLRADRLTAYGARRVVAPTMEELAREGVVVTHARAQSSWTLPTVATLLTGLAPAQHGAELVGRNLPAEVVTLAERLREHGYRTGAVSTNPNVSNPRGFAQGFERFDDVGYTSDKREWATWDQALPKALAFLDTVGADEPFFLYYHILEPHRPYAAPALLREHYATGVDPRLGTYRELERRRRSDLPWSDEERAGLEQLYDAEVASADRGLAAFLDELDRRGRLDETIVLLTADHGEELLEHGGLDHGHTLFEEQLRVPMVWKLPAARNGRRLDAVVDQLDVTPTLLELAGLPVPAELPGRSFAAALAGAAPPRDRPSPAWLDRRENVLDALAHGGYKLKHVYRESRQKEPWRRLLFDLGTDPGERDNLIAARPIRHRFLVAELDRWSRIALPTIAPEAAQLDAEQRAALAALGYL